MQSLPCARDVMATHVVALHEDDEIDDAIARLTRHGMTGAPVVDADHKLTGFLSERDCLRALANGRVYRLAGGRVRDHMTTEVTAVRPDCGLLTLAARFVHRGYHVLPVTLDDGTWIGHVRRRDVLAGLAATRPGRQRYPDYRRPCP